MSVKYWVESISGVPVTLVTGESLPRVGDEVVFTGGTRKTVVRVVHVIEARFSQDQADTVVAGVPVVRVE